MSTTATYSPKTFSDGSILTAAQVNVLDAGIYDTHYGNAGAHNSFYRGKSIGTSASTSQYSEISDGTFDDLFIGDYWTISSKVYRTGAFNYYLKCGDTSCTTNHILMVPDASMYNAPMNATATTDGAYIGSAMYIGDEYTVSSTTYTGLTNAKSTIEDAFGSDHILSHRVYLTNAVTSGYPSAGAWSSETVLLMNEEMVYGCPIKQQMPYGGTNIYTNTVEKSQLPLFQFRHDLIGIRTSYWLRDVVSASYFAFVYYAGYATSNPAAYALGVRPCFCICA